MKIAIISNCQGLSLVECLREMNSNISFEFNSIIDLLNGTINLDNIVSNSDHIFAHNGAREKLDYYRKSSIFYFPSISYRAFHPDMTYVRGSKGTGELETVTNSMIMYHSAIILVGFLQGIEIDDLLNFFNPQVYHKLGYMDMVKNSQQELLEEGLKVDMPLAGMLSRWEQRGSFMFSMNHPHIHVMADIARVLMIKASLAVESQNVADYAVDPLKEMTVWPIYPGIAEQFGLRGDFAFRRPQTQGNLTLRQFIADSYRIFEQYDKSSLEPLNHSIRDMQERLGFVPGVNRSLAKVSGNPYRHVPPYQFWKNAVEKVAPAALDPVVAPRFQITISDKIATAGSCFAQHIARTLSGSGFNYFVPEFAPAELSKAQALESNFGVYSARYGNIYTVRQLRQLLQRISGEFIPIDNAWLRKDGRRVDPFRPQIEPAGFADEMELTASRETHFAAVREMITQMNVFVFTLGLTEGWRSRLDGAVFPLAPGVAGGEMDFDRYEFINFTVDEINADLDAIFDILQLLNPGCKVLLTVSPVPLIATFEPQHALVATTYSKSVLRVAADRAARLYEHVAYFPSYEIITGHYNHGAYYDEDLRSVKEEGVQHVMGVFMRHYTRDPQKTAVEAVPQPDEVKTKKKSLFDIVCDEEAIANF